ncbi:hypothetical protein NIES4071_52830 [Calothrix sp. NIES-4071]|nr:hypothetical protein NIES4071_52830 [Calothrix sp. NIES-4071]BAZ59591.1 hypothetical protein NIES4105_52780 [Calothrix sp. NIES-4105]
MKETDTPDNGASKQPSLSETARMAEPVDCPFYSVLPHNSANPSTNQILPPVSMSSEEGSNASDSEPQVFTLNQEQWESEIITDTSVSEDDHNTQHKDWVAEPDSAKLAAIDAEFQLLLALNHELRAANNELYSRVEELTSRLAESEKAVQFQQKRYSVTEAMLKQQTQELCATQEQVKSLYQQLDNSLQNVQRQETLVETYKAQLEFNQQRLAQLERECALLQTNYSSQSQQLIQSETACRELRTRLMRQQRQTLQFKAALEKCLDPMSGAESNNNPPTCKTTDNDSPSIKKFKSLFVNAQPIKPWSADEDSPEQNIEQVDEDTDVPVDIPTQPEFDSAPPVSEVHSADNLDEQIESVIQMYFVSQSVPASKGASIEIDTNQKESVPQEAENIWDTVANEVYSEVDTNQQGLQSSTSSDIAITPEIVIEVSSQNNSSTGVQEEVEDYWAEVSQLTHLDLPATESPHHPSHNIDDANSPSPVVYPRRPPKGRKSMSSVQLPKFPPKPQQ